MHIVKVLSLKHNILDLLPCSVVTVDSEELTLLAQVSAFADSPLRAFSEVQKYQSFHQPATPH